MDNKEESNKVELDDMYTFKLLDGGELPGIVWKQLSKGGAYKWCTEHYQKSYKKNNEKTHRYGTYYRMGSDIMVQKGGYSFTPEDALVSAEHFQNDTLPEGENDGKGVQAAYGFSVAGNAKPYFMYQTYKGTTIVNTAKEEHYGLLAHIFWVQGCDGYMGEDAVGVAVANKIGKNLKNEYGGYDEYLTELTRIMDEDDKDEFNILLQAYNDIESTDEILEMKKTDKNSFIAFISVTGGGLRRKATKRKASKRKASKRKATKRKAFRRKSMKRRKTKRKATRRKATKRKSMKRKNTRRRRR